MKTNKILSIALLGATIFASAQVKLSGRANLLFKTDKPFTIAFYDEPVPEFPYDWKRIV